MQRQPDLGVDLPMPCRLIATRLSDTTRPRPALAREVLSASRRTGPPNGRHVDAQLHGPRDSGPPAPFLERRWPRREPKVRRCCRDPGRTGPDGVVS